MSVYQKRHYEDVAEIMSNATYIMSQCDRLDCGCKVETPAIIKDFADLFAKDNNKFDRERFLRACGLEEN